MASSTLVPGLSSPEVQAFATGFPVTLAHGAATLALLLPFRIVDLLLPGLARRIVEAEISAGIVLFAAKLATALVLAAALSG